MLNFVKSMSESGYLVTIWKKHRTELWSKWIQRDGYRLLYPISKEVLEEVYQMLATQNGIETEFLDELLFQWNTFD